MKLVIWANFPSPHQRDFYRAVRASGVDLRVVYLAMLDESRSALGWAQPEMLPMGESYLPRNIDPLEHVTDWRERIHIIPGYGFRFNRMLARKLSTEGVPWVHWSENSQRSWKSVLRWGTKKWYAGLLNRYALGAFAIGECATKDFKQWGIRAEKIAHLYYAIDGLDPNCKLDSTTQSFVRDDLAFIYVGCLNRRKATLNLIYAFAKASAGTETKLVLVGNGPHEQVARQLCAKLQIVDRVLFRGVVNNHDVGTVLKCCDCLVLPSRHDGWGVVLNEAASAGLALIASDAVGAAYHLVEPGWNGIRVAAGSVSSLQNAMSHYVKNESIAVIHGTNSQRLFQEFTPERNAERLISALATWQGSAWMARKSNSPGQVLRRAA